MSIHNFSFIKQNLRGFSNLGGLNATWQVTLNQG